MSRFHVGQDAVRRVSSDDIGYILQRVRRTFTFAQLQGIFTTGIDIIPAPGAGRTIVLQRAAFTKSAGPVITGLTGFNVMYKTGGLIPITTTAAILAVGVVKAIYPEPTTQLLADSSPPENIAVMIQGKGANAAGGPATVTAEVWYVVMPTTVG